ncbi:MAG TPA: hypothetical protein VG124_17080 [Beijerinckiaceae bacterium]|nr:hypothetical protein [Beijerinckiaceae bacterium]
MTVSCRSGRAEGRPSVRARTRAIFLKRLKAALLLVAVVAAALLIGIVLAKIGHSLFNEERTPSSLGNG